MFGNSSGKKYGHEIIPDIYYFTELPMLDCVTYVIKDQQGNLMMIDPGNGLSWNSLLTAMELNNLDINKLTQVLITHEHLDHVLGLYPMMEKFKENTIKIRAHPKTAAILEDGDEQQICPRSLGISAKQFGVNIIPLQVSHINEGDKINFGNFDLDVFHTPGHSIGSATFYEPNLKILFPGDVVFPEGSFGRYDFPGGSLSKLKQSISRIANLDVNYLCAGHMQPVSEANKQITRSLANISTLNW